MDISDLETPIKSEQENKRSRIDPEDPPVSASLLQSILNDFNVEFEAALEQTVQTQLQVPAGKLVRHIEDAESGLQVQHDALEQTVISEKVRATTFETEQQHIRLQIQTMQASLAIAEGAPATHPLDISDTPIDYIVILALIRVTCARLVAIEDVSKEFAKLAEKCNFKPEHYHIQGGKLATKFTVKFRGSGGIASRRAKSVLNNMRNADGSWSEARITRADATTEQIFLSPGKHPAEIARETSTEALSRILAVQYPTTRFFALEWQQLAKAVYHPEQRSCSIACESALATSAGIDTDMVDGAVAGRPRKQPIRRG
jgi:hypothetical protein